MPYIEQLLYGYDHLGAAPGRRELARSAGMGSEVSAEIIALCDAWGKPPLLGLQKPVLLSHPLRSAMPSLRGRLFAVIRISAGETPLYHAAIVSDALYGAYGRNPYALAAVLPSIDQWTGQHSMERIELETEVQSTLVGPPPNPEDVGLVDEAVLQFILTGKLQLPLEQAVRQSDRALALIIACLPDKARKELHFASFTTLKANAYHVASVETEGATFAGWQRLMMARLDTGVTESQQEYKTLIARHLGLGDLAGVARVSSRHNFTPDAKIKPLVATRQGLDTPAPVRRSPTSVTAAATVPRSPARGPGFRTATATIGHGRRQAHGPEHGLDPAAAAARQPRSRLTGRRGGAPTSPGRRGGSHFRRAVAFLLLAFFAGWVGTMWLEGRTLAESLTWAGLPGMDGGHQDIEHSGSLLEVVDVGGAYTRALKHVEGSSFGLKAAGDKGREKALGRLRVEAANPLLEQIDLLTRMSTEGIQQSGRSDREIVRLEALADQARVIEKEFARLELAWYSFTTGSNWQDLAALNDNAVEARRDSLERVEPGSLADVRVGLAAVDARADLATARHHVAAMAELVRLFRTERWSLEWEEALSKAAERVSPNAGQTTRAYRNSAFALLRLKKAERESASRALPFAATCDAAHWPSAQVRGVLPLLRKEAGRFADQNAPSLLAATLSLYRDLENPVQTIEDLAGSAKEWQALRENAAVRFDPQSYADYLDRLRYEAAWLAAADRRQPENLPAHLVEASVQAEVAAFAGWRAEVKEAGRWRSIAGKATDPFLARWANHLAGHLSAQAGERSAAFDRIWQQGRSQTVAVQSLATAGREWTAQWRGLYDVVQTARRDFADVAAQDPAQAAKFTYLAELQRALEAPLPLAVSRVTVRLEQPVLDAATDLQLELRTPARGAVWTSQPFATGPSAPAGTGWVGTAALAWDVPIGATQKLSARVVRASDQKVLFETAWESLASGAGPAQLARQTSVAGGSLGFRLDLEAYWAGLKLPDLGLVF